MPTPFPDGTTNCRVLPPLSKEQFDAVITGLNLLYDTRKTTPNLGERIAFKEYHRLLTDGGHEPITQEELDELIQHINDDSTAIREEELE